MARDVLGLKLKGFDKLKTKLDVKKFRKWLKRNVRTAQKRNALFAEGEIKSKIMGEGNYASNSVITIAIKGSSRPLVDTSGLVASITHAVPKWDIAFIGVLKSVAKTSEDGRKYDLLNVAFILHEGATIKVTQKMRNFFAMMARENPGRWFPMNPGTKVIHIPRRPFLEPAESEAMEKIYVRQWNRAIQAALSGRKMR